MNPPIRKALLRTGMGCFLFAAAVSLVNGLLLPFARACYAYPAAPFYIAFALALGGFALAARAIRRAERASLERARRVAVPAYLAALFVLHIVLGYLMEYVPAGDNFMLYNSSQMLARDGNFALYPDFGLYLARFSNQWGFVLMLTLFWKLLAVVGMDSFFMPLVFAQALLYMLGMRAALSIIRRRCGVRGEMMLLCLLALCLPLYLAASVLYTDTFSLPFVLIVLDLAQRASAAQGKKRYLLALACGAVALIGAQIKMTVVIALVAAVICWLLTMKPVRAVVCAALSILTVWLGTAGVQQFMLAHVIDPDVYAQQNTPLIHWVMMSIPTGDNPYGGFSGDYGITWGMMDEGATHEEVMDSIYSRIKDRIYTLRYPDRLLTAALRKNAAIIGDGTFGMTEMLDDNPVRENAVSSAVLEGRPHYALYSAVCSGIFMAQLALAAFCCLRDIRRRDTRMAMLYIAVFGMLLFLMLWEARSRYLFSFVPVILLLAATHAAKEEERA